MYNIHVVILDRSIGEEKSAIHLEIEDDRARACECLITAGHALHTDTEGAVSLSTVILQFKKKIMFQNTSQKHKWETLAKIFVCPAVSVFG